MDPHSLTVIPLVLAVAAIGTVSVALLPRPVLLVVLILVRSMADIGSFNPHGSLLPGSAISASVAVVAIFALVIPSRHRASPRAVLGATIVASVVTLWTILTVANFGYRLEYVGEVMRTMSLVAVLILAYRVGAGSSATAPRCFTWIVGVPAAILIVGYVIGWAPSLIKSGRAAGTFSHPNSAAAFFTVGIIACLWAYRQSRSRLSLAVAFAGLVALLLTQSLGAISALGVGGGVLFALNTKLSPGRRIGILLVGLVVLSTLFMVLGSLGRFTEYQSFNYGSDADTDPDSNSLDWRFANWKALLPIWWNSAPLLGLGWASTRYDVRPMGEFPHSIVVQLLVETGLVGCAIVIVLSVMLAVSIRRRFAEYPETAAALAAIGVSILIHGIEANWLNYSVAEYLALFAIGVMLGCSQPTGRGGNTPAHSHHVNFTVPN